MAGTVLFSRANFDLMTYYLSVYSEKLIKFAQNNGYDVIDLTDEQCRLPEFSEEIAKKPSLLIGCGHGGSDLFTGQDMEVLLQKDVNDNLLKDVSTYLWSCQTGLKLGPSAVEKGCPMYFGYTANWTVLIHSDYLNKPLEDPWANPFFDCGLTTGYAILQGKKPKEIYDLTIERYNYWWNQWLKQESEVADDVITWLNWDRNAFTAITSDGIYNTPQIDIKKLILPVAGAALLFFLSK